MDHLNFQEEVTFLLFGVLFFSYWWDEQFGLVYGAQNETYIED